MMKQRLFAPSSHAPRARFVPLALFCIVLAPAVALAQGSGSAPTGSGSAPAGSAAPTGSGSAPAGSGSAPVGSGSAPAPQTPPEVPPPPPTDATGLRKTCVDAMNADPAFAESIVQKAYDVESQKCDLVDAVAAKRRLALDVAQHDTAAKAIAKNQKHVIMAYAAMWLIAVGFVLFLWRRQQLLKVEIAQLRTDLDAATKDK